MLSVIIPALNESENIEDTVKSALACDHLCEVIVVDGGSWDDTARRAARAGAKVLAAGRGRARQMNAGAGAAKGDALLFLHADTALPAGYDSMIRAGLRLEAPLPGPQQPAPPTAAPAGCGRAPPPPPPPPPGWGAFSSIAPEGLGGLAGALLRWGVGLRTRLLHRPYGDQGIFMRAQVFRRLGGYRPELPLLEDLELTGRLQRAAGPPVLLPGALRTSGRRWRQLGVLRTTALNQAILLGWGLGVDPNQLAGWYDRTGHQRGGSSGGGSRSKGGTDSKP